MDISKSLHHLNNVTNVNKDISNNVNSNAGKYALNPNKFTPQTEETQLAKDIATFFNDLGNYAFYRRVVKNLGTSLAYSFWKSIKEEINNKKGTRYEIRDPKKYFAWKFKNHLYG